MFGESEEKVNFVKVLEEIKVVIYECDEKVVEMMKKVELIEFQGQLVLCLGFQLVLNFDYFG